MGVITEVRLKDVRCFEDEQSARVGRITLLVGENNAGKSTFLGCCKALATLANLHDLDDKNYFDDSPFHMGSFDTIVRSGKTEFSVGGRFQNHCYTNVEFAFSEGDKGIPFEQKVKLEFNDRENFERSLRVFWSTSVDTLRFEGPNFQFDLQGSEISYDSISTWLSRYVRHGHLPFRGEPADFRSRRGLHVSDEDEAEFAKFITFLRSELPLPQKPSFSVSALDPALPPRRRVYESLPVHLASDSDLRIYQEGTIRKLGLWKSIEVQPGLEGRGSQVQVKTKSGTWNLTDVGYGIHSILPLAQFLQKAEMETIVLLQQPEVHVHPAIQAQLAQLMVESNSGFIIETHSDHLLERLKICVMEGVLQPEELSIVYFGMDSNNARTKIHNIEVDSQANLLNAPEGYRKFFMEETMRSMGFKDVRDS